MKAELKEEWKSIFNFPNYQISNFGNICSIKTGKRLKPWDSKGYLRIGLYKTKDRCHFKSVHRLILETFIGPSNLQCNHIDGNKHNNKLSNLEYCTGSQNLIHAYRLGLQTPARGENNGYSKLTNQDVKQIKFLLKNKFKQKEIAILFNVHPSLISYIKSGKIWSHIND